MKLSSLLILFILLTSLSHAQHWRIEVVGGVVTPNVISGGDRPPSPPGSYYPSSPSGIPSDRPVVERLGGLKLMRRDSAIEYGIGVSMFNIGFRGKGSADTGSGPFPTVHNASLASPAIPIRAFFNYTHHRARVHSFIGASAGFVVARGKDMQDAYLLNEYSNYTISFHNAIGYTFGIQLGVRRVFGRFDVGGELAANFMHLPLTQGTSNTAYKYNLFYFPVQLYIGYSF